MVSTKIVGKTVPEIDAALKNFSGDMVKIEYLENCLKQMGLANDVLRFCHVKLADLYAYKLMWGLAGKQMDNAAERATTYKDKLNYYLKEIDYLVKAGDYLMMDKAFKKAILCGSTPQEKEAIKSNLKQCLMNHGAELETRNRRSNAAQIYEKMLDMGYLVTEAERKELMIKIAAIYSKTGKLREAIRYEQMLKKPQAPLQSKDPDTHVRKVSWEDLGIENL
jgi:tetratricopeptide (TPR) repeat protein